MHHIGQADIPRKAGRPIDLRGYVDPRHRLSRQLARTRNADRQRAGHAFAHRLRRQRRKAQPVAAVDDEARLRAAIGPGDAPASCRRLAQQRPRGRARGARIVLEHAKTGRSAGQHRVAALRIAVVEMLRQPRERAFEQRFERQRVRIKRVDRRRLDADRPPVGTQFVRHHLPQRGIDALPVLQLRHRDGDMAVVADLQPCAERGLAGCGREIRGIGARPQPPGDDQPDARASRDDHLAPADPCHAAALPGPCGGRKRVDGGRPS